MSNPAEFPVSRIAAVSGAAQAAEERRQKIHALPDEPGDGLRVFYVSERGQDGHTGLSPASPMSFAALAGLHLRSGDVVLLERGSVFRIGEPLYLCGGVRYGTYGAGEKPLLMGSLRNYAQADLWEKSAGSDAVWVLRLPTSTAGVMTFEGDAYAGVRRYSRTELRTNGDYYHDTEAGRLYLYSAVGNPGAYFTDIEIGTTRELLFAQNVNDIQVRNIRMKYASIFGINAGNNRGIRITGCELSYIGGYTFKDEIRYGNGIQFWLRGENLTVCDCAFSQIYDAALTFQGCGAEDAYFANLHFAGNLMEYCSMNFEYWAGKGSGQDCRIADVTFTDNIVRLGGYGWGGIQRPDKGNQALVLGWNRHYDRMERFVISDNLFDCADGNLIFALSPREQTGLSVFGNTYYQRAPGDANPFREVVRRSGIPAAGQAELTRAVALFDSAPRAAVFLTGYEFSDF